MCEKITLFTGYVCVESNSISKYSYTLSDEMHCYQMMSFADVD